MFWLFTALIIGLNIAPFVFNQLPQHKLIWFAQGLWAYFGVFLIMCGSFFFKQKEILIRNTALGLLSIWIVFKTLLLCYLLYGQKVDISNHFIPLVNFVLILIIYHFTIVFFDKEKIEKLLLFLKWAAVATMVMCVLQHFGLSQYFRLLWEKNPYIAHSNNNIVVGFVGNGTLLSGQLALYAPLFFKRTRENFLCLTGMFLILCTITGTTAGDPALTGLIVLISVALYSSFYTNKKLFIFILLLLIISGVCAYFYLPKDVLKGLLSDNGRLGWFKYYWEQSKLYFITGRGLGTVNVIRKLTEYPALAHLHLEYFHFLFELGLIGFLLILNLLIDFFKSPETPLEVTLKSICFGFCVACIFNSFAHLWIVTVYICFCYASIFCLKNEQRIEQCLADERLLTAY